MNKGKNSKGLLLYCIPLFIQLTAHIVASGAFSYSTPDNILWRVIRAVLVSVIAMMLGGEGWGSIAFIVAGFNNRVGSYVAVIILSIIGAGANFAGYMISGIEGLQCLWMTIVFWCIDLFLFIFSIKQIDKLPSRKTSK